jgi:hypothetical protein
MIVLKKNNKEKRIRIISSNPLHLNNLFLTVPASFTDYKFEVATNFSPAYGTCVVFLKPTICTRHTAYMLTWHLHRVLQRILTNSTLTDVKSKKSN